MHVNSQRGLRNYLIRLFLLNIIHIFLLTGCQQKESVLEADSSEMHSQTIMVDQALTSREETGSEPYSAEEMRDDPLPSEEMSKEPISEGTSDSSAFGETMITDNRDYFIDLCFCVPYFDDIDHLDESSFYPVLVNMSVCGPLADRAERVDTDIRPYYMAKISRADMEEYMLLLFGKEFPTYEPSLQEMQEKEGNVYYEDGFYYIGWFDPVNIIFTYVGCEWKENGNLVVEFAMSEAINGSSIVFELAPADNENGFIIVSKRRKVTEPPE